MINKIENYKKIKDYCASFTDYQIYDYLYFIGITNVKPDINDKDLLLLMDKCEQVCGEYTDPIEVGQSLANEVFEKNSITMQQLEKLTVDQFYDWYNGGRNLDYNIKIEEMEMER